MSHISLSAKEFAMKYHPDMKIIDVRSPAEYAGEHVEGAKNVPLDQIDGNEFCQAYVDDNSDEVYLICQAGTRAAKAAEAIRPHTEARLYVIEGGTPDSIAAGCPAASTGKKTMSIERQVRVAAGALVFIGTALGWFVHPGFFAVPAFVGAGLFFAGVTDTCAMGMMLAKMPWNR